MGNGIIAGNQNKIPPELDAQFRNICINANGHNLSINYNSGNQSITLNGVVFAYGAVCYFKNVTITNVAATGYVYVDLTTHQDEEVEDEANAIFSTTLLTETHPNISLETGTYRMRVANMSSGIISLNDFFDTPQYATEAETCEEVSGTIAENAQGVTQATSDNSTKIATTEFVKNAIADSKMQSTLTATSMVTTENVCYNRLGLVGVKLKGSWRGGTISAGTTIATLPSSYRPSSQVIVSCWFTFNGLPPSVQGDKLLATINTTGTITLNGSLLNNDTVELNCCFLAS